MEVKTTRDSQGIPPPAISVSLPSFGDTDKCFDSNDSIEACIKENTYNRSMTLGDVLLGFIKRESFSGVKDFFTEDYVGASRLYSFRLNSTIGTDGSNDQLFLLLYPNLVYTIYLHDPDYFLYSTNPVSLPTIMTQFDTRATLSQYYRLDLTEVHELDVPEDPCEPKTEFHTCIRRSVSDQVSSCQSGKVLLALCLQVGCRVGWDSWSNNGDFPTCTSADQFRWLIDCSVVVLLLNSYLTLY